MSEQELKLHVPKEARASVEKELLGGRVTRIRLQALYFDTPSCSLIQAKIALRLRREDDQWVQTFKMPSENSLSRIEFNHDRPSPELDLSVYAGTPVAAILEKHAGSLSICYETDVNRVFRQVRTGLGMIEIALDVGVLRAGLLELPISEIEFELKRGQLTAVFALGKKWQQKHGLILDVRSKSERGDRLALLNDELKAIEEQKSARQEPSRRHTIAQFWAARTAEIVDLHSKIQAQAAISAVSAECLDQIIRNSAIMAEVDTAGIYQAGGVEHVHQLRVGIRRLRSAWSFFNGIATLPSEELRSEIKVHFAKLGGTRDDDVLKETLLPVLYAAGQPPLVLEERSVAPETENVALSRSFQSWLLDTLAWIVLPVAPVALASEAAVPAQVAALAQTLPTETLTLVASATDTVAEAVIEAATPPTIVNVKQPLALRQLLVKKLKKWHRQLLRDGLQFDQLSIDRRHELRKLGKKLRYALQFTESLLPATRLKIYRKQLANVQDILGEMNDLAVAHDRFIGLRDTQPSAWFACGWITSRLDALTLEACSAFKQLSRTKQFCR